jgi:hypothetical protein
MALTIPGRDTFTLPVASWAPGYDIATAGRQDDLGGSWTSVPNGGTIVASGSPGPIYTVPNTVRAQNSSATSGWSHYQNSIVPPGQYYDVQLSVYAASSSTGAGGQRQAMVLLHDQAVGSGANVGAAYAARLITSTGGTTATWDLLRILTNGLSASTITASAGSALTLPATPGQGYRLRLLTRPPKSGTAGVTLFAMVSTDGGNSYCNSVQNPGIADPLIGTDNNAPAAGIGLGGMALVGPLTTNADTGANGAFWLCGGYGLYVPDSPGFVLSHLQVLPGTTYRMFAIGNGAAWLAGTQLSILAGAGAGTSIGSFVVNTDAQYMSFSLTTGAPTGPLVLTDGSGYQVTLYVTATTSAVGVLLRPPKPPGPTVASGGKVAFEALVLNDASPFGVNWTSVLTLATNTNPNAQGIYTGGLMTGVSDGVTATSKADPTKADSSQANVSVAQPIQVTIKPASGTPGAGTQLVFTATVTGTSNPGIAFSCPTNNATIDPNSGLCTCPATYPTSFTIRATSAALGTAYADANMVTSQAVTVTISGTPAQMGTGQTAPLVATVLGNADTTVIWTTTGGFITPTGTASGGQNLATYQAPSLPGTYSVTAQAHADTTRMSTVQVLVLNVAPPVVQLVTKLDQTTNTMKDYVSVLSQAFVGMNPTAGYHLYAGPGPACNPQAVDTKTVNVTYTPSDYPVTFTGQPTASAGTRNFYLVKAFDTTGAEGPASASLSSVQSGEVASGATYQQLFTASYGPANTGLGPSLGYQVFDQIGAPLGPYTKGLTENAGTGVYTVVVALDTAWSGYAQLDAPGGAPPTVVPFGPVHFDGTAGIPATDPTGDGDTTLYGYLRDMRAVVTGRAEPNPGGGIDYYDPTGTTVVKTLTYNDTLPPTSRKES